LLSTCKSNKYNPGPISCMPTLLKALHKRLNFNFAEITLHDNSIFLLLICICLQVPK